MTVKRGMAAALVLFVFATPALADAPAIDTGDSNQMKNSIVNMAFFENNEACTKWRGGGKSGRQIGVYRADKGGKNYDFHSKEYLEQDPAVQARWAVTFHQFIVRSGGGYPVARALQQKLAGGNAANNILNASLGGKATEEAINDKSYVPYTDTAGFADTFFRNYGDGKYGKLGGVWADWFKNDAILDAVNLWNLYEEKELTTVQGAAGDILGADSWTNMALDRYSRRVEGQRPEPTNDPGAAQLQPGTSAVAHPATGLQEPFTGKPVLPASNQPSTQPGSQPGSEPVKHLHEGNPFKSEDAGTPSIPGEGAGMKKLDEILKKQGQ